jgi:hypothetical protein
VESAVARLSRDPVMPEPLPEHWKDLLRAMTAQDPRDRPRGSTLVTMLRDVVIAETAQPDHVVDPAAEATSTAGAVSTGSGASAAAAAAGGAAAGAAAATGAAAGAAGAAPAAAAAPAGAPAPAGPARPATLDLLPEEALQRTTAMAARLFDAPIALVEVLDEDREWSQSWIAEGVDDAARKISFRNGFAPVPVPVVIPDGSTHPEMRENPLVTGPLGIRFYVSVPLLTHEGAAIGTLAVLDTRAREATDADLANLRDLAALAMTQLEIRQESLRTTSDALPVGGGDGTAA